MSKLVLDHESEQA